MGPSLFEARLAGDRKGPGGCGCRHAVEMRADGFGPAPTAPDEQVGRERRATQEQGRLERDMRKLRRAKQVLEECGSDSHPENVRIRAKQAQLRALVRENGDLVKRERHRERVYSKARAGNLTPYEVRRVGEETARTAAKAEAIRASFIYAGGRQYHVKKHLIERMEERGIKRDDIVDAIENPVVVRDRKIDPEGRASVQRVGKEATVVVNPDSNAVVSCWKTGKKALRRAMNERNGD